MFSLFLQVCLFQYNGDIGYDGVHIVGISHVIKIYFSKLSAVAEKYLLFAVGEHDPAKIGFFNRNIGHAAVQSHAPAGEKQEIGIDVPDKVFCLFSHIGKGVGDHLAAGTKGW